MYRRRPSVGLLLAGLMLSAFPSGSFAQSAAPGPGGTGWRLTQVAGSGVPFIDVPPGVDATLAIDGGRASGSGGCNSWFADVKIEGDAIVFGPIGSTKMACPEPNMSFEQQYLGFLGDVQRWAIIDGDLQLSDANGAVLLVFSSAATGTIEGIDWQVTQILDGAALAAIPTGIDVSLLLQDGRASGDAGCNSYFGAYLLEGGSLTFKALGATEMACPEPRMTIESGWLTVLGLVTGWQADGDQRWLLDPTGTVLAVLEERSAGTIVGPWTVAEVNNGKGAIVLTGTTDANLVFTEDGSVSGSTGCNVLNGAYVVEGGSIKLGPLATTRMACKDEEASALESELLAALEQASTWAINAEGWLELSAIDGQLLVGLLPGVTIVS